MPLHRSIRGKHPQETHAGADIVFRKLVEHMNEAVWVGNQNERTVYANPKFCELMEYSLEEMIGRKSYGFWDEESAERVRSVNALHRAKGISSNYEGNLKSKSGKLIPVLLSGTPLPDGGTVGIMTDLRELKKKEHERLVLHSAVEYATEAILIFNNDGHVTTWNKGAKTIFGFKREEMIGQTLDKIFPRENIMKILKSSAGLTNVELKGIHKNKHLISISGTLTPIFSQDKKSVTFCLLIARDVTSQKRFEEELTLKYQKIKDAYFKFGLVRRQMDYILDALEMSSGSHDRESIADYIVSSVIMLTRVDACVLRAYDLKSGALQYISSFGVGEDWKGKAGIPLKNSLAETAFQKHQPLKIIDVAKEPRYKSAYLAKKHNLSSLLLLPLFFKGKPVGTLSLYVKPTKKLEIFENEFIENYAKALGIIVGTMQDAEVPEQETRGRRDA